MWWTQEHIGYELSVSPDKFYRMLKGVETHEEPPEAEVVAAMLLQFPVVSVELNGPGIRSISLSCGITLHLSPSRWGAYVNKMTRSEQ